MAENELTMVQASSVSEDNFMLYKCYVMQLYDKMCSSKFFIKNLWHAVTQK